MLPIKDTIRAESFPLVNWLLIIANGVVWFFMIDMTPGELQRFAFTFGLVPANINLFDPLMLYPFVTHMFLHGGWLHFISNIWILIIFGDNVEDRLGSFRYLIFYLLGGLAAAGLQAYMTPGSRVPAIGASGAIAAVMGAYFLFYPRAKVITLVPLFIFPYFLEIPAIVFLGFWFISQLYSGVLALAMESGPFTGGIAWWAHIGGFVFGLIFALPLIFRRRPRQPYPDEYYPW
ncbi:MAG: rhomboid family intramembrane serine protease [Anaerolineaceae bacterium]|jgi:membrane associated rhomboid family serine protease